MTNDIKVLNHLITSPGSTKLDITAYFPTDREDLT